MRRCLLKLLGMAALLWAGAASAQPWPGTLLFQGGELADFNCLEGLGRCGTETVTTRFRSAWARVGLTAVGGDKAPYVAFESPPFAGQTSLWVHAQYCGRPLVGAQPCWPGGGGTAQLSQRLLYLIDDLDNPTLVVRPASASVPSLVKISSLSAGGGFTDLVTCSGFPGNTLMQLDLEVIDYGAAGTINMYVDSNLICTYTGDITNGDGATTITKVAFGSMGSTVLYGVWSEILVGTADTRSLERKSSWFVSTGNTENWDGDSCATLGARTSYNDASFAYTGTNNQLYECIITATIPAGVYEGVVALGIAGRALASLTGPSEFRWIARIGGTEYTLGSNHAPPPSFANGNMTIQTTNPATGLAWQIADFPAPFNLGMESRP